MAYIHIQFARDAYFNFQQFIFHLNQILQKRQLWFRRQVSKAQDTRCTSKICPTSPHFLVTGHLEKSSSTQAVKALLL